MKLGAQLGTEAQNLLYRAVYLQQSARDKQRRKARVAELNRKRSHGDLIRYSNEDR